MDSESTIKEISTISLIVPPLLPSNPIVNPPNFLAVRNPFSIFFEFPLVEIPITTSSLFTKLSH